jgi:peptide deformylase
MRFKIVQAGEPVLRQVAHPLTREEILLPDTGQVIEWMQETMRDAPGVGLAAPQIGLSIQLAVIEDRPEYQGGLTPELLAERERRPVSFLVLINPRITQRSERQVEFYEGCLSVAGFSALVPRSHTVTVEYLDRDAVAQKIEARGWFARILQHEIDHLNGRLYVDRMEPRSFSSIENLNRYWKDLPVPAIREALGLENTAGN